MLVSNFIGGLRYPQKRVGNRKRRRWKEMRHLWVLLLGFEENFIDSLSAFCCFFRGQKKQPLKALFHFIPWLLNSSDLPTIICIIFWDFLMFYQGFLSQQVKRCAIITYKHGIYELPHELTNGWRLRILGN